FAGDYEAAAGKAVLEGVLAGALLARVGARSGGWIGEL
ncbi:MAG: hypothetical protein JWQ49_3327, partial [Edaphobacter sp.]|nr:hypothetical protein [Edaphobacter sp.]